MARSPRSSAPPLKLTPLERRSSVALATLFAARMLGLFLLTPIFAVAARTLVGGDDPARVGLALGVDHQNYQAELNAVAAGVRASLAQDLN